MQTEKPEIGIEPLRKMFPWPDFKPGFGFDDHGWVQDSFYRTLENVVTIRPNVIVEIGSWLGKSTRYMADRWKGATIICIDLWSWMPCYNDDPEALIRREFIYERFISNCWDYRHQIIPIRKGSIEGMNLVVNMGVQADLVYIDGDHSSDHVMNDTMYALDLFKSAQVIGDDWTHSSVRKGVSAAQKKAKFNVNFDFNTWWAIR